MGYKIEVTQDFRTPGEKTSPGYPFAGFRHMIYSELDSGSHGGPSYM